ncbi:exopolysaccharide biosynthesis polyprenyl glycosylphosphotransferase [Kingella kingae]|nr:exopolysaccharide biosynthesis polyprenyl glycosylphosphotransferase [Kingella kingae]MDK4614329.1 exopolysaccharide biosynthesis polyprenyl glycosylphosphotransferase [Kingella kingae]
MLVKRLLDIVCVLCALPFALPLMLLTAIAIRLESSGSVLFTQNRVGQGGREFRIYKFRSMSQDSEKDGAKLAQVGDSRITQVGHFIRKTRLDELPQFFNILKGDMSLIGPRPEQKVFVEQFEQSIAFYNYRHIVKPGLSGWAQVTQGYAGNEDETRVKIEHDFYYIKHFSLSLDLLIVFKTIKIILTGFGAR